MTSLCLFIALAAVASASSLAFVFALRDHVAEIVATPQTLWKEIGK